MAEIQLLVDTDIFVDFLNTGLFSEVLQGTGFDVYYSVVTEKELLAKPGISDTEKRKIIEVLRRYKKILLALAITSEYARLRSTYPHMEKATRSSRQQRLRRIFHC